MKIEVKNDHVLKSLLVHPFDPKLIEVVCWIMRDNEGGVITEGFRIQKHKNDLHGLIPVRAIDIRSWCYSNPASIEKRINFYWQYDYNRPDMKVCFFHNDQGEHFHIQVHPHTRRRVVNK